MSSPTKDSEDASPNGDAINNGGAEDAGEASTETALRPPAKRPAPAVIEISDTDSDDSDICAVTSYQASADEVKRIRGGECGSADFTSTRLRGNLDYVCWYKKQFRHSPEPERVESTLQPCKICTQSEKNSQTY